MYWQNRFRVKFPRTPSNRHRLTKRRKNNKDRHSGMPSLFHALSGVRLIVAACFDVPIPILPECLVCRPECPTMHGIALRHIITPLTQNTLKIALFRECLSGVRCLMENTAVCRPCSMLFRVSVWLWQLALMFLYFFFRVLHKLHGITLYYIHIFFHLSLAFSLFRSIFFITNPCITQKYMVLHHVLHFQLYKIRKLYISLFWYLKYWKCRSCINFISN